MVYIAYSVKYKIILRSHCEITFILQTKTFTQKFTADSKNRVTIFRESSRQITAVFWRGVMYRIHSVWLFAVDGGHRAVIFDRFRGIQQLTTGEGTHFLIPWVQRPIIFDIRSQPRSVPTITGSKGLWFYSLYWQIMPYIGIPTALVHPGSIQSSEQIIGHRLGLRM